jgi:DNA invertase Pin-like site-specific DNA recombinase
MLQQLATDGAKTIIVESPDRFARDLAVQLAGHDMLKGLGIAIIPASAPDFFTEDTPTAVLVRQVLGAIAQFEKASSVAKLAAARKRKREREGRCEGRKPLSQTRPEVVALARKLRRRRPKAGQLSLREVSKELAARGYLNERNKPYAPKSVASMCVSGGLEGLLITGTGTGVCRWSTARGRGRYAVSKATMGNETQTRVNRPTACSAELWSSPVTEVP